MKIKFNSDRDTVRYGSVKAGQTVTVSDTDGEAFVASGLAEPTAAPKKEKSTDG